ncbi:MAG: YraN family protein, partial [Chloroflexota bacterium]
MDTTSGQGMPHDNKTNTGRYGEALAKAHLEEKGYAILAINWKHLRGEIDVIAQSGPTTVFVEVRTRHAETTESAFASITMAKRQKMIAAAHAYLEEHNLPEDTEWRIDVIAVAIPKYTKPIIA